MPAKPKGLADPEHAVLVEALPPRKPMRTLRTYQVPIFQDHHTKVLLIECARQIGKSHTFGEWAAVRLLLKLQQVDVNEWLIVLISNSKANGVELGQKVAAALRAAKEADEKLRAAEIDLETPQSVDTMRDPELGHQDGVPDIELSDFAQRIELRVGSKRGRVLVLAASPRTARGFSADLGLDEFAFHENASAIWDAAYPMLDSNPQFVARICSTHNGISSLFNTWIKGRVFPVYSMKRSDVWRMGRGDEAAMERFYAQWRALGPKSAAQADAWFAKHGLRPQPQDRLKILSLRSQDEQGNQKELTPEEAEMEATDKASYRQNYENDPADAGGAFLTWELITKCEDESLRYPADKQAWSEATLARLYRLKAAGGEFFVGKDFARVHDLSVDTVLYKVGNERRQVARLEMRDVTSPDQRREMEKLLDVIGARTGRVVIDSTGAGMGLAEELSDKYGALILLVNFSQTVPLDENLQGDGRTTKTMGIPERMALDLQKAMEDGHLRIAPDSEQRDDLRKPCRVLRNGRVSVAAARTAADHADRFWALALAEHGIREGVFGAWDADTIKEAAIGSVPVSTLPAYVPFGANFGSPGAPALSAFLGAVVFLLAGPLETPKTAGFRKTPANIFYPPAMSKDAADRADPPLTCLLRPLNRHSGEESDHRRAPRAETAGFSPGFQTSPPALRSLRSLRSLLFKSERNCHV